MSGPGDDFYRLSKALKAAGNKKMRSQLNQRIKKAAEPMKQVVRDAARAELPKKGGLNETVAARKINVSPRTGRDPGIKLVMPKTQPGYLFGDIKHPVFEKDKAGRKERKTAGDKSVKWVEQHIGPGEWFDDKIVERSDLVRDQLE
jgi:hypothetical protein